MTTTPHTAAASVAANNCTILPDGSAFAADSFPLPKDHWLYAPREYDVNAENPKELPSPILTHALRAEVVSAIRYAIRGATMCGKETDFDPDALVQNAVYALCGPYGSVALATPAQAGEYPPLMCDYCGALTSDPWHSSGMLHGKMSKHIHSCDACAAQGAAQAAPVDAERLDYLQECGVTVEVLPGRPGWTFRIGGLHGTVHRSVRTAIDAARAAQGGA